MGSSQAFWVVYGPVWVNNFSPHNKQALWLGMLAGFSPVGIMLGYIFTAFIINIFKHYLWSWRISIIFQAVFEIFCLIIIIFVKQSLIDIAYEEKQNKHPTKNIKEINFIHNSDEL